MHVRIPLEPLLFCDRSSSSIRSHRGTAEAKMSFSNVEHNLHITINASCSKSKNYFSPCCRVMWKRKVRRSFFGSGVNINCYHFTTNILRRRKTSFDHRKTWVVITFTSLGEKCCYYLSFWRPTSSKTVIWPWCGMYIRP